MPDHQPADAIDRIRQKSHIHPPGVGPWPERGQRRSGPLRILWAARWEHDKNPEDLFRALRILKARGIAFRVSVLGEQFRASPDVFAQAHSDFADQIDCWGYQEHRSDYTAALGRADVFVSTANHEFFGLSAVEATLAGAWPVLPRRLAYPEVFDGSNGDEPVPFFYDGTPEALAENLADAAQELTRGMSLYDRARDLRQQLKRFEWPILAPRLDDAIEQMAKR
jgi:glycosyltransferase involved in cell wall biosynthesis